MLGLEPGTFGRHNESENPIGIESFGQGDDRDPEVRHNESENPIGIERMQHSTSHSVKKAWSQRIRKPDRD